jgi:ATP-dependent DNA ligase
VRSCLIGGEAIACDADMLADFQLLRHRQDDRVITLCAFDLLELDDRDLRGEPIDVRKRELASLRSMQWALAGGPIKNGPDHDRGQGANEYAQEAVASKDSVMVRGPRLLSTIPS